MIRKHHLIDISIKVYYIHVIISFIFNYILYQTEKVIVWIYKIYLYICSDILII